MPQLKLGIFPNIKNSACCKKYVKNNKHNKLHLTLKICLDMILSLDIICPAKLTVYPLASLLEGCSVLRRVNVHSQKSEHLFAPNGSYSIYLAS